MGDHEEDCTRVHENTPKSATCRRAYEHSNMKKPEEVEQLEPKNGMQKKCTLCGKVTFVLPLDNKMPTTPLWPFSADQKDFTCRHKEVREELITKKKEKKKKQKLQLVR